MPSDKPLSSFSKLKETLQRKGISVISHDTGYIASSHIISNIDTQSGSLEISEGGIFFKSPDGSKHRGFLYLMESSGISYPKAHICECSTLQDVKYSYRTRRYIWANKPKIFIKAYGGGSVFEVEGLDICKNCLSALNGFTTQGFPKNTVDFVRRLESGTADSLFPNYKILDIFGRTKDWYMVRQDYLQKVNHTCEECGKSFESIDLRPFIEVVHLNGNVEQNVFHNLKCLCVGCRNQLYPHATTDIFSRNLLEMYEDRFDETKKKKAISNLMFNLLSQFDIVFSLK